VSKASEIRPISVELFYLTGDIWVPLKFGPETFAHDTCPRMRIRVQNRSGKIGEGRGETPLRVQWIWPSKLTYSERLARLQDFCRLLAEAWADSDAWGDPLEVG
jgi:hypothetical protein